MSNENRRPIGFAAPWQSPAEATPAKDRRTAIVDHPVWAVIIDGIRLGLWAAWRILRTGWPVALLFLVIAAERSSELRALASRHYELQVRVAVLAAENALLAGNSARPSR